MKKIVQFINYLETIVVKVISMDYQKLVVFFRGDFFLVIGILTILPFLINSFFTNPAADDFLFAVNANEKGFWQAQWGMFTSWQGRYTSVFLLSTSPLVYGWIWGYKLVPLLILILLFISILFFINAIAYKFMSIKQKVIIVLMILLIYFHRMPSTTWGLFWMSGAINWQMGNIFSLLFFSSLLTSYNSKLKSKVSKYNILSVIFLFLSIGTNEIVMVLVNGIIIMAILGYYLVNKSWDKKLIVFLTISLLFSSFVIFAPGNTGRMSVNSENGMIIPAILASLKRSISHIGLRFLISPIILFSLLFLPTMNRIGDYLITTKNKLFQVHPIFVLLGIVFFVPLLLFPLHFGLGANDPYPQRVIVVIYFYFILAWFYLIQLTIVFLKNNYKLTISKIPVAVWVALLLFYVLFPIREYTPVRHAYRDLISGRSYVYNQQMKARFDYLTHSDCEDCVVEFIEDPPETICYIWLRLSNNKHSWINQSQAQYFNKKSIIAERQNE